ncbi:MAG: phosphate-starvation-inducible PsiE family protein [Bacteroidales bacterium]
MKQPQNPKNDSRLNKVVKTVEKLIIRTLIGLMTFLLVLATLELAYSIVIMIWTTEGFLIDLDNLMNVFGVFMLVLIGIELLDTIKVYFREHIIHVEVVMLVALIAVARKVIIMNIEERSGLEIVGIASIIIALSAGYFMIKKTGGAGFWPVTREEEKDIVIEEKTLQDEQDTAPGKEQVLERKKTMKTKSQESIPEVTKGQKGNKDSEF